MRFELVISCDNAAFGESAAEAETAVARMLADITIRVENGEFRNTIGRTQYHTLRDCNGNDVGRASFIYDNGEDRRE